MFHSKLKETLNTSIAEVVSDIDSFVYNPGRDYSHVKNFPHIRFSLFLFPKVHHLQNVNFWIFFRCHWRHLLYLP